MCKALGARSRRSWRPHAGRLSTSPKFLPSACSVARTATSTCDSRQRQPAKQQPAQLSLRHASSAHAAMASAAADRVRRLRWAHHGLRLLCFAGGTAAITGDRIAIVARFSVLDHPVAALQRWLTSVACGIADAALAAAATRTCRAVFQLALCAAAIASDRIAIITDLCCLFHPIAARVGACAFMRATIADACGAVAMLTAARSVAQQTLGGATVGFSCVAVVAGFSLFNDPVATGPDGFTPVTDGTA